MIRIKIHAYSFCKNQFRIENINGDYIGLLSKDGDHDRWLFAGADFFESVTEDKKSMFWIEGTYEYAVEKINTLVEKYVNRFFEKE